MEKLSCWLLHFYIIWFVFNQEYKGILWVAGMKSLKMSSYRNYFNNNYKYSSSTSRCAFQMNSFKEEQKFYHINNCLFGLNSQSKLGSFI